MHDIFLFTLIAGATVLVAQIVLTLVGFGHGHDATHIHAGDGLDLLSVRTISAGATLFGATGLWVLSTELPDLFAGSVAVVAGLGTALGTAYATRQLMRLESDGSLRLENAVRQPGTVYLPIPARRQGFGMVQFALQGRTVELRAVADEPSVLPTGAAVIITAVLDAQTVEVVPTPQIEGIDS
jgi:hypothetical protein